MKMRNLFKWIVIFNFCWMTTAMSQTIPQVLERYGAAAQTRLQPWFERAAVPYPPQRLALLGFKAEKALELWAQQGKSWVWIRTYPILAASGVAGPKLKEGDLQVPEGIYRINLLNPNSKFHLSMQIDYPNTFDRRQAAGEQRTQLGGEIFIHGKAVSVGCLAMGDTAIEELFSLVATVGMKKVKVIIAPQRNMQQVDVTQPSWQAELYQQIYRELQPFQKLHSE
jgi:murein L,D-transpeptidase YafK